MVMEENFLVFRKRILKYWGREKKHNRNERERMTKQIRSMLTFGEKGLFFCTIFVALGLYK